MPSSSHGIALLLAGAALCPTNAFAQAVDYQALQETIGEPVTTSVTGKPQRASEVPASTIIITREDIARSPARDVPGLLKTYAGIDVNRWTAGQSDVAVRGGVQTYNPRLLVLVDGRQVYLDHYGTTNWNLIGVQPEEIQQIELVRGPAAALFGFNAASGVVNIITRRIGGSAAATVTAEAGNHGIARLAGTAMLPVAQGIGIRISGARLRENERRIPASLAALSTTPDVASDQLSGEIVGKVGETDVFVGAGHAVNRELDYLPSQLLAVQRLRSNNVHARAMHDTSWGGLSYTGYVNLLNAGYSFPGSAVALNPFTVKNRIIANKASAIVRLSRRDTLRAGVEYRNNRLRSADQFSRNLSYDVASADVMLDLHPTDTVAFSIAGRLDHLWQSQSGAIVQPAYFDASAFHRSLTRFSFNAALVIDTGNGGRLRLNGGRGYQLPPLATIGFRARLPVAGPLPVYSFGSPDRDPVTVWSGELSYGNSFGTLLWEATGFATRTDGALATAGDGLLPQFFAASAPALAFVNTAPRDYGVVGAELSLSQTIGKLTWSANYTWTHTDERGSATALPIVYALSPGSTTPAHKANLSLSYDFGRLSLSGVTRYTSATRQFAFSPAPQLLLYRVSEAAAVDARIGFRLTSALELFAAGENLTLAGGAAVSPIPADRRIRAGGRFAL